MNAVNLVLDYCKSSKRKGITTRQREIFKQFKNTICKHVILEFLHTNYHQKILSIPKIVCTQGTRPKN